jgi:hypothetical protein
MKTLPGRGPTGWFGRDDDVTCVVCGHDHVIVAANLRSRSGDTKHCWSQVRVVSLTRKPLCRSQIQPGSRSISFTTSNSEGAKAATSVCFAPGRPKASVHAPRLFQNKIDLRIC